MAENKPDATVPELTQQPPPAVAPTTTANAPQFIVTGMVPAGPVLPTEGIDTTIPGGKYRVGDQWQNANGQEIDERGKVLHPEQYPPGAGF